ncbi:MAG: 30S ribosomal protein S17 [Flavobacteriaceae bacterium]|nr:30S ribosomal protein S17 [Flavobacteriaceae bacterium]
MRKIKGVVTGDKMDKTIVVSVHTYKSHPKYKKRYRVTKKFYAHDEDNTCVVDDLVLIAESRPLSRSKRWVLEEKLS